MVGMGANGHLCPLTQYARHLGIEATMVYDRSLFYTDERSGVERVDPLVPWQDRFADRVDSECAERFRHNPVGAYRVTGALAAAILDKIPE